MPQLPLPARSTSLTGLRIPLLLACAALLGACPDPTASTTGTEAPPPPPAGMAGQAGGPSGGQPGATPGGGPPAQPGGAGPQGTTFWEDASGPTVTLSGTLSYAGTQQGQLRVDFLGVGQSGGLKHTEILPTAGTWTVKAPVDAGPVQVVAFVDIAGDGPSTSDPAGRTQDAVQIGSADISGIDIVLSDTPELGDLTPGAPPPNMVPPSEGGPAPEGTAPPAGAPPVGGPPPAQGSPPAEPQ